MAIRKIPPCRDRKRLRSSVPCHLVGSADCHRVFPQKLLRRLRYGAIHLTTQTPRDDPVDCPCPRRHCLSVESPRRGNLRPTTICQLRRPAKPDPVAPFGDRRLPLLPLPLNRNRHSQPAPWSTPSRFREDYLDSEGEDQGGKTPAAGHRRELHSRVQNIPSDTCLQECLVLNQNIQGLKGGGEIEKTIEMMIEWGIHGYCMQEIWLLGSFSRTIRGHLLLHHDMTTKPCHRGRTSSGVPIILGPALLRAWNMAVKPPPITSAINSEFPGRMIGVTLCFPNRSNNKLYRYHKRGRGKIKIFLDSIYHPVE